MTYLSESAASAKSADDSSLIRPGLPRSFDIVFAVLGLIVLLPLLLVAAALVVLTSSGGFLFRQQRVGHHGQSFTLFKLRTMRASESGPQVTSANDARITSMGRLLRKTKLDELPTLWNVLRGDMSFVGPRPEVPRYVNLDDPVWQKILTVRPGITDPVTLELRHEEDLLAEADGDAEVYYREKLQPLKLQGYVAYLKQRTWGSDLKVLFKTVAAVVIPST